MKIRDLPNVEIERLQKDCNKTFASFHRRCRAQKIIPTAIETWRKAYDIGLKAGLEARP